MALTPGEKQLLEVGFQALHDKHAFKHKLARELEVFSVRRRRGATEFRRGIMKAAFRAAGIDSEEIARRREKENRSVLARIRVLNPQVSKNARIIAKRQKDQFFLIQEFAKRLPVSRLRGLNGFGDLDLTSSGRNLNVLGVALTLY